jgi:hypothetical protein
MSDAGATGERFMLDPKETKKGGFGAFAQRDRERREAEALKNVSPNGVTPPGSPPAKPAPASEASSDASGTT